MFAGRSNEALQLELVAEDTGVPYDCELDLSMYQIGNKLGVALAETIQGSKDPTLTALRLRHCGLQSEAVERSVHSHCPMLRWQQ